MLIKKKRKIDNTPDKIINRKIVKRILKKISLSEDINILTKLKYKLGKSFVLLPLINRLYLKHFSKGKKSKSGKLIEIPIGIRNRSSMIYPALTEISPLYIHNGKKFIPVTILKNCIGHKFGEFVLTRNFKGHKKKNKPTGIKKKVKLTRYTQFFENCLYLPNILKKKLNFFKEDIEMKRNTVKKFLKFVPNYPFNYISKYRRFNKTFFIAALRKLVPLEQRLRNKLNKKYKMYKKKKLEFYKNFKKNYNFRMWLKNNFKKFSLHLKKKRRPMTRDIFYKKYIFKKQNIYIHKF
jgi:small subunit ribosomal protein S19